MPLWVLNLGRLTDSENSRIGFSMEAGYPARTPGGITNAKEVAYGFYQPFGWV